MRIAIAVALLLTACDSDGNPDWIKPKLCAAYLDYVHDYNRSKWDGGETTYAETLADIDARHYIQANNCEELLSHGQ